MRPLAILLSMAGLMVPVFAQAPTDEDGPGRGVARLSLMNGEVSIRRGDSGDFVAAAPNAPLVVLDRVLTGPSSRAELQFDSSNMIRVGANAEVRLSELEYHRYQVQIAQGTTTFRVLRNQIAQVELSTPSVAVRPLKQGVYRITVHEDGTSEITVRNGEAEITSPRGTERLGSGRTMVARGTAVDPEFQVIPALPVDDWDNWNESRDHELLRSQSFNNVSPDVYGAEDLDNSGVWTEIPSYGRVWRPTVTAEWAPYRNGRWVWVDYYGWTWVSYDSWGWAPYHYGRWVNEAGYGWCWWPGGSGRTYWRPALVAFFGWGAYGGYHSGIGFGYAHVGWVPLAPHEPYHPWYGRGYYGGYRNSTVLNNTTIINNSNISSMYRNARVNNGITGMNAENFGRGHVTPASYSRVSSNDIQRAGLVRGQLPLTPGHESLRMADRSVMTPNSPRMTDNRQFFSNRPAARIDRVPFEQQRQSMDQSARRTFADTGVRTGGAPVVNGRTFESGRGSESTPAEQGGRWRRVGETPAVQTPRNAGRSVQPQPQQQQDSWHRFGEPAQHTRESGTAASSADRNNGIETNRSNTMAPRNSGAASQDNNAWRRFGDPSGGRVNSPADHQATPQSQPRYDQPSRQNYTPTPDVRNDLVPRTPQQDSGRSFGSASRDSAPVRINPPIVRERSAPAASRSEAPRSSGGGSTTRSSGGGGSGGGDRGGHKR